MVDEGLPPGIVFRDIYKEMHVPVNHRGIWS